MATAIVAVRFDSHQPVRFGDFDYAHHRVTVLARYKADARIPDNGRWFEFYEMSCQFCTEDGEPRPWNTGQPIPAGSHKVVVLTWDEELQGFRIFGAVS